MYGSLHYDYQAPLEHELLELQALRLIVGDTIVADGAIPLRVTDVRPVVDKFITVGYECAAGSGFRTFAVATMVTVLRYSMTVAH